MRRKRTQGDASASRAWGTLHVTGVKRYETKKEGREEKEERTEEGKKRVKLLRVLPVWGKRKRIVVCATKRRWRQGENVPSLMKRP